MPRVYLSIGSNLEREFWVSRGVALLREAFGPLQLSRVYETKALGFEGDEFLNLAAAFDSEESPARLAVLLRDIEFQCGRERHSRRFAPRTLDIDMILYGSLVEQGEGYRVPREELLEYAFMLGPLAEIAPDERHPVEGRSYAELWAAFDREGQAMRVVDLSLSPPD